MTTSPATQEPCPKLMPRPAVDAVLDYLADEVGYASFARDLRAHIAALTQRVEADSKDAARYRWMRASGGLRLPACIGELVPGYDYDAGIDARIASETSPALPKEPRDE